jgi:hypothetical protein
MRQTRLGESSENSGCPHESAISFERLVSRYPGPWHEAVTAAAIRIGPEPLREAAMAAGHMVMLALGMAALAWPSVSIVIGLIG